MVNSGVKTFKYWNNKAGWHSELMAEIQAADIVAADKIFETQHSLVIIKTHWISCSLA